ncbi:deoxynucleoside kinase [Mycoplasmopsis gallinacea]|uniref:Deoxynucleoside kinase n=1 Tax=Mycoplasmopsis gallinacea TaxID=29556 RepID=A0A6H0V2H9_9BACT|nr:deoxynucleoside kinase [Mycoplasmopsis gallinacea]QIW62550.1 deoxynucleoside kinase [Mycoplasmopsis gallinacea]
MLIGISGMISSGKSTLSKKLAHHFKENSILLDEFMEDDDVFNQMLNWFYERKENLDLAFQAYVVSKHIACVSDTVKLFNEKKLKEDSDFIFLDRFSAEHYVFAKVNLSHLPKKVIRSYDALFNNLVSEHDVPEFAIFLDVSFENFKKRIFERGREVEINNWEKNKDYFQVLYNTYKKTFIKIANKYNIKYEIIDTNTLNEEQVFEKALELLNTYKKGRNNAK